MLKTLIKARLLSLFASPGKNKKKNGKKKVTANSIGKKILIGILAIYIIAVLFLAFGMIFFSLCEPYHAAGNRVGIRDGIDDDRLRTLSEYKL